MMLRVFPTLLVFLPLTVFSVSGDGDISSSCTTSGKVNEGDPATVTCTYTQNLENNKKDYFVYRNKEDGSEPVIVAICAWDDAGLNCDHKPGYNTKVQGRTVTLEIQSAQPTNAGSYSCSTLPAEDGEIQQCNLFVQGKTDKDKMNIFCNKDGGQTSVMCVFPESLDASTVTLERHDLLKNTEPVEVMHCDKKKETCTSALPGYETIVKTEADNFKTFRVNIPSYAADKSGLYVCKADSESALYDMCTLKPEEVATRPEPEKEALLAVVVPLYLILVCLILLTVIALALVIKRCREKPASPEEPLMSKGESP